MSDGSSYSVFCWCHYITMTLSRLHVDDYLFEGGYVRALTLGNPSTDRSKVDT